MACFFKLVLFIVLASASLQDNSSGFNENDIFQKISSIRKTVSKKIQSYTRKYNRMSISDLNFRFKKWLNNPSPQEFFYILRDTLLLLIIKTFVFLRMSGDRLYQMIKPTSKKVFEDYIIQYVPFNPYLYVGSDSVSYYIQSIVLSTFAALFIPVAFYFLSTLKMVAIFVTLGFIYFESGTLGLYMTLLFFISIFLFLGHFLITNPSFLPLVIVIFLMLAKTNEGDQIRTEIYLLRQEIERLKGRIENLEIL